MNVEYAFGSADDLLRDDLLQEVYLVMRKGPTECVGRVPYAILREVAKDETDPLVIARRHFDRITDRLGLRWSAGDLQPDGFVLARPSDLIASQK